jgi:hypothetical protein
MSSTFSVRASERRMYWLPDFGSVLIRSAESADAAADRRADGKGHEIPSFVFDHAVVARPE